MRKLLAIAGVIFVLGIGALVYLVLMKPAQRPPSAEQIERTPQRLARGEYLAEHVLACFECHSDRDMNRYGLPLVEATKGSGTICFAQGFGFPGRVWSPNITPDPKTGIGSWTDGELMRAIREGIHRDGSALFGFMPYSYYRSLSDEDTRALVVYLRSIPAIEKARERTELDFPINLLIKFEPEPLAGPVPDPDAQNLGKYLAEIAGCRGCHTPVDAQHREIPGRDFAGGQEFPLDVGVRVFSTNITPDPKTGIGKINKETFIGRFKAFEDRATAAATVPIDKNTVMPWLNYAGMKVDDLSAIYDYLQTVTPIENRVRKR
jgi:hypothetical protein